MAKKKAQKDGSDYKAGNWVVYPTHGVGKVIGIEDREISGTKLKLIVISFEKDRMTLRVPTNKAKNSGLRKLSSPDEMKGALKTLKGRSRVRRTMWSRRAQNTKRRSIRETQCPLPRSFGTCIARRTSRINPTAKDKFTRRRLTAWRENWPPSKISTRKPQRRSWRHY